MIRYAFILLAILATACQTAPQSANNSQLLKDSLDAQNTASKQADIPADKLIVPGKYIGQTQLNEDADKVFKRLGKPDAGDAAMGKAVSIWYADHDTSGYQTAIFSSRQMGTADDTSRVKQIRITSPWFVTREGLHVGSDLKELNAVYKLQKTAYFTNKGQRYDLYDTSKGLIFEVDEQNTCSGIVVHEAGKKPTVNYLPFYTNLKKY